MRNETPNQRNKMMTIITKAQADKLIESGDAELSGHTYDDDGKYAIITRYDLRRVDHYYVSDEPQPTNAMS